MKSVGPVFHLKEKKMFPHTKYKNFWTVSWSRFASKNHVDFHNSAYSISYEKDTMEIKQQ